jgi:hypothetical protein
MADRQQKHSAQGKGDAHHAQNRFRTGHIFISNTQQIWVDQF